MAEAVPSARLTKPAQPNAVHAIYDAWYTTVVDTAPGAVRGACTRKKGIATIKLTF